MTFEEAKQRSDYKFLLNGIQDRIKDIRKEYLEIDFDSGPLIGEAILEIGYVDIEVNISILGMFGGMPVHKPIIEYFMCFKTENDWETIGYLGIDANVNWWSNRWKEELEKDMFLVLDRSVRFRRLSYNRPN